MCRFAFYNGDQPILIKELADAPKNSLIKQSLGSESYQHRVHGDGFGLLWYDHAIEETPGLFRSIQPIWNDRNLSHLMSKVKSNCIFAHIRDATVGEVSLSNCHPMYQGRYSFMHQGSIYGFDRIRRLVVNQLSDSAFDALQASTDSAHLFALIMSQLALVEGDSPMYAMEQAMFCAFDQIIHWQKSLNMDLCSELNIVFSNGNETIVSNCNSKPDEEIPVYYHIESSKPRGQRAIWIASEPLSENQPWEKIPTNHYLTIDSDMNHTIKDNPIFL